MADKKFTLLELHLGNGAVRIGPAALGGGADDDATDSDSDEAAESDDGCGCPGRKVAKLLLALLVLALLAVGIKTALGGGEDLDELEDLADLDERES